MSSQLKPAIFRLITFDGSTDTYFNRLFHFLSFHLTLIIIISNKVPDEGQKKVNSRGALTEVVLIFNKCQNYAAMNWFWMKVTTKPVENALYYVRSSHCRWTEEWHQTFCFAFVWKPSQTNVVHLPSTHTSLRYQFDNQKWHNNRDVNSTMRRNVARIKQNEGKS